MDLIFEEPPAAQHKARATNPEEMELAAKLKEHPGKYVVFLDLEHDSKRTNYGRAHAVAQTIRTNKRKAFMGAKFDSVARTSADGTRVKVYVKYLGEHESQTPSV